jgi:hypothetical protein
MNFSPRRTGLACLALLAGGAFSLPGAEARAAPASMGFQNQLKVSVYVEAATVVQGRVVRDKPLLLHPGKTAWHMKVPPGNRVIYIYLVNRPGQLLFRGAVTVGNNNLFYAIQPHMGPRGVVGVKVVPAKPTK